MKITIPEIIFIIFISLSLGFLFGWGCTETKNYKSGQIDAINGIIKYELVVMPDQTKEWREIE